MSVIQKLQSQPQGIKKLIFWSVMILSAFLTFFWWWHSVQENMTQMQFKTPAEGTKFPSLDLPAFPVTGGGTVQQ